MKIRPLDIGYREDVDRRARALLGAALVISIVGAILHHLPGVPSMRGWMIAPFRPALLVVGGVRSALMEAVGAGRMSGPLANYDYRMNYYAAEARSARLLDELNSLRATINLPEHASVQGVIASVTSHVAGVNQRVILVDKGRSSGVAVGNVVLGAVGDRPAVIGRVIEAGPNMAKVLTLADPTCRIPARIGSEGGYVYTGMPQRSIGRLEFVPRDLTVTKGDEVVTSEDGILFPGGMLIGTITGVGRQQSDFQEVLVAPAIPVDGVKYVWVARQVKSRSALSRGVDAPTPTLSTGAPPSAASSPAAPASPPSATIPGPEAENTSETSAASRRARAERRRRSAAERAAASGSEAEAGAPVSHRNRAAAEPVEVSG